MKYIVYKEECYNVYSEVYIVCWNVYSILGNKDQMFVYYMV